MPKQKIEWKKAVERRHPPIFIDFLIQGQSHKYIKEATSLDFAFGNVKKVPFSDKEILGKKWFGTLYFDGNEIAELKKITKEGINKKGTVFLKDYIERCYNQANTFLKISNEISTTSLEVLSNEEILALFNRYAEEAFKMSSFLLTIIGIQFVLEEEIKAYLEKILVPQGKINSLEDFRRKLSVPIKKTPEIENMVEIIRLSARVQKDSSLISIFEEKPEIIKKNLIGKEIFRDIEDYVKKFAWIQPMYYRGEPMSIKDAILQIQTSLKRNCIEMLEKIKEKEAKSKEEYEETIKELNPPKDFLSLLEILQEFLYLRTYRLEIFFIANHLVMNLLKEIAKRLEVSYDDVLFLRCKEIIASLEGGKLAQKEIIKKRKKAYSVVMIDGVVRWYSGKSLIDFLASEPSEEFPENEVRGRVAWPGEITGRAKLVLSNEDMKKVLDGDILVTTMTTPSLMPAIQKASGIVTNEGGILSHAAIVSREFGIPCIIGTEYATYVFKDNDLVEIYATSGSTYGLARKLEN